MENTSSSRSQQTYSEPSKESDITRVALDKSLGTQQKTNKCFKYCLRKYNTLPNNAGVMQKVRYGLLCPPFGCISGFLTRSLLLLFVWLLLLSLTGNDALPGGNCFSLLILFISCSICGSLIKLCHLPSLLGMLLAGFALRNIPFVNTAINIDALWSSRLRSAALAIIMMRAGLGLDATMLRKLSFAVVRLAFTPCVVEATAAGIASILILGIPWMWALMLGFILGAVSPAVVVPGMLSLMKRGIGADKGIPTLVIAAASIDDVLAITGFGVFLAMTMSTGGILITVVKAPLEVIAGILYGIISGLILWYLPSMDDAKQSLLRFVSLLCIGLVAIYGSVTLHLSGAGALGCLTVAFVAAYRWRLSIAEDYATLSSSLDVAWVILKPLLFGLIGAEVNLQQLQLVTIGYGLVVLAIGLVFRSLAAFLVVFGMKFTSREKLFVALAWLPKATVQAAIGSVALDTARSMKLGDDIIQLALQVLTIAVLSIMITAPIGAVAIALAGPRCLALPQIVEQDKAGKNISMNDEIHEPLTAVQTSCGVTEDEV